MREPSIVAGMTARRVLGWLAAAAIVAGLAAAFGYAPREDVQGNVQRIMYLHVPAVLTAYLAFGVTLLASLAYLGTRRLGWDRLAALALGGYWQHLRQRRRAASVRPAGRSPHRS